MYSIQGEKDSMNRFKVLFVSPTSGNTYGAEKALYQLLASLPRERISAHLLVQKPIDSALRAQLAEMNVTVVEARFRAWCHTTAESKKKLWRRVPRLVDNLRVAVLLNRTLEKYDLIYSNTTSSPIGAIIASLQKTPHIWHIHDHLALEGSYWRFDWPIGRTLKWAERNTDIFVCFSQSTRKKWAQYISTSKLRLIDPGLLRTSDIAAPRVHWNWGAKHIRLCILGGITESKGQHEIIQALPLLIREGFTPELTIAGTADESYKLRLIESINSLQLTPFVKFVGYVEPHNVFDSNDLHIMCTRSESAPRVAIESMARGCPSVATDIDGVREFIIDGMTGLHYPVGQPEVLAQRIIELWRDPARYARLSQNGIEFVRQRFLIDRYVENIVTLIEEVVRGE
jgi:glycosyltransferase involved in cell wall biosynthesis